MKKVVLFSVLFLVLMCNALAARTIAGQRVFITLPVDDNLEVAGGEVSVSDRVHGDLLCAGGRVIVDGAVDDDVGCAGGDVTINNEVNGDLRILGGNVVIGARVRGDLTVAGGNVLVKDSAVIGKDVMITGGNVVFLGNSLHNVGIIGGYVIYGGNAANNVFIDARRLTFEKAAHVVGNLTYSSNNAVDTTNVRVNGLVFQKVRPATPRADLVRAYMFGRLLAYLALLLVGLILLLLLPKYTKLVGNTFGPRFWKSIVYGLLVVVVAPVIIVLLLLTVVGIPLALIGGALYLALLYLAKLASGFWLAEKFGTGGLGLRAVLLVLALLIIYVIVSIPVAGVLINVVITVAGVGAMVMAAYFMVRGERQPRRR